MDASKAATKSSTPWKTYAVYAVTAVLALTAGYFAYYGMYGRMKTVADEAAVDQTMIDQAKADGLDALKSVEVAKLLEEGTDADALLKAHVVAQKADEALRKDPVNGWFWTSWGAVEGHTPAARKTAEELGITLKDGETIDAVYNGDYKLDDAQAKGYLKTTVTAELPAEFDAKQAAFEALQLQVDTEKNGWTSATGLTSAGVGAVGAGAVGAGTYFGLNKVLGEEQVEKPKPTKPEPTEPKIDPATGKPVKKTDQPKIDPATGKPVVKKTEDDTKDTVKDSKDNTDGEDTPKTDDGEGGIGGWAIFFIILACLAVVGGLVYFFFFMPKDEDEEFDAEAQDEQNEL